MNSPFFDIRHIAKYIFYGLIASVGFTIPIWVYLSKANYGNGYLPILGSIIFITIILVHSMILTQKAIFYKSNERLFIPSIMPVFVGVLLSVIFSLILCFLYIPDFMTGHSTETFLKTAPEGMNHKNTGTLIEIFLPATIVDLGVGIFVTIITPVIMKVDK